MNSQQPTTEEPRLSSLKRAEALGSSAWTSIVFRLLRQRVGRSDSRPLCPPENESQHVCTAGAPRARRPPPAPGGRKEGREDLTKGSPPRLTLERRLVTETLAPRGPHLLHPTPGPGEGWLTGGGASKEKEHWIKMNRLMWLSLLLDESDETKEVKEEAGRHSSASVQLHLFVKSYGDLCQRRRKDNTFKYK